MAFTPIPIGSLAWGTPVNNALSDQDARISDLQAGGFTAGNMGLEAMAYDPVAAVGNTSLVSGTVYMVRLILPEPATISLISFGIFIAGAGLTAGQNFAGIYDLAGNRVAVTADQTTEWASIGVKDMPLTAPYAAPAGDLYVAWVSNGATPPALLRAVSTPTLPGLINRGLAPEDGRWTTGPTAQTSLPATVTMSARSLSGTSYWTGVA